MLTTYQAAIAIVIGIAATVGLFNYVHQHLNSGLIASSTSKPLINWHWERTVKQKLLRSLR